MSSKRIGFIAGLVVAILVGTFLRLYLLRDQILVDDEWHGLIHAAAFNSLAKLLTYFSLNRATCLPLNVYNYLLLETTGWSEMLVRLPSVVAGLISLILFPTLIKGALNCRTTLIFAGLLAISPFLIFYSRMARPYSLVTLFGFAAIWSIYLWATKGERRYLLLYVVLAALAICFHLFAAIGVLAPLGCLLALKIWEKFRKEPAGRLTANAGFAAITVAALILIAVSAMFAVFGLISSGGSMMMTEDRITVATAGGFLTLLAGTSNSVCLILFVGLLGIGVVTIYNEEPLLGSIFAGTALCYFGALVFLRPLSVDEPVVVTRYVILLFPLSLLVAAFGADITLRYIERRVLVRPFGRTVVNLAATAFIAALLFKGPLPSLYSSQNNFTNHCAFQGSYKPLTWEQAPAPDFPPPFAAVSRENIPDFYWQLAREPNIIIIEYPAAFVDVFNLYYYYQHFHKKRLLVGYLNRINVTEKVATVWIDQAVSFVREPDRLHFRNMVNLEDVEAIRASGAKYVILHPNLLSSEWTWYAYTLPPDYSALTGELRERLIAVFGLPAYWDKNIVVFEIH